VRRSGRLLAWTLALGILAPPGPAPPGRAAPPPGTVRLLAVGYRHLVSDAASVEAYRAHLLGLARRADPAGARDPDPSPKVLLFPEDAALYAMASGLRGLSARALEPVLRRGGGAGAILAVAALVAAAQPQAAFYRLRFPEANRSEARLGLLALTDTIYRTFFETLREIARRHRAWVVGAANVAPARVVRGRAAALALADPALAGLPCSDVPAPCAYEATSPNVYNQAFVFDPAGRLVRSPFPPAREGPLDGAVKKTYLVPIEQGPLERGRLGLDLVPGDLRQVRPVEIAGVPMGIVISKPAWMPDELGRLEAYDARILLQPEAFSSWGSPVEDWPPDVVKQSGWAQVQKRAPFRASALAALTGNFFDMVFDGQSHVVVKATERRPSSARYVGQPGDVGWAAVGPWVVGDGPGEPCHRPTLAARRACLQAVAAALAPGSGDPRENGYREPLAAASVLLGPAAVDSVRAPGALGPNRRLDDAPTGARARNPQVATDGTGVRFVVWQDDRTGLDQVRIARLAPDGTVGPSRPVAPRPGVRQVLPLIAVAPGGGIHVVWQELDPSPGLRRAFAPSWEEGFGPAASLGAGLGAQEQWTPAAAADPAGTLHVAWIALVGGFERLAYSRLPLRDGIPVEEPPRLLDAEAYPAPNPLAARLNNRWNPAIAVAGRRVAIAWTDFRSYAWDLFATVSSDGGRTFGPHLRVDDAGRLGPPAATLERLHDDPAVVVSSDGTVGVAWTDQAGRRAGCRACPSERRPDADIAFASLGPRADGFSANVRVDDTGDGLLREDRVGFSNQWRPALVLDPATGRLVVVWQDHRGGNDDIFLASSADGGRSFGPSLRVDDTGDGVSNQTRPSACADPVAGLTVVWQDDRDGQDGVWAAWGRL
jgi:predicted amidohydrolase